MNRAAWVLGIVLSLTTAGRAQAFEFRLLGATDLFIATTPGASDLAAVESGLRLRAQLLNIHDRVDLKLDYWGRAGLLGNPSASELRELSVTFKNLGNRVDLTFGRFLTPGGFWLQADGGRMEVRYTRWLSQSFYGGLRSFTTARQNADLNLVSPIALPLAGTALLVRHRLIDASLTFTYARDAIDLLSVWSDAQNRSNPERHVEDEYFLDAHAMLYPLPQLFLAGGGSLGTRYDVQLASQDRAPAQLGIATLGAVSGWGMLEWRPHKAVRIHYQINYERIRLIESQLLLMDKSGNALLSANGSFTDNSLRLVWLAWRALRVDAQYRVRYRENTDLGHHLVAGLRGDDLWRGLGGFASVGVDIISPGITTSKRVLYSAGLSYVRRTFDLRAGILFTDGIGSGLLFSQHASAAAGGGTGVVPTQLFPYLLESNRVAFIRLFGAWGQWFAGVDVEENIDSVQLRAVAQLGISR